MQDFQRLKELRKTKELSQLDMAELLELSQGQYSAIENGRASITYRHLQILREQLDVDPLWVMTGERMMLLMDKNKHEERTSNASQIRTSFSTSNSIFGSERSKQNDVSNAEIRAIPLGRDKGWLDFLVDFRTLDPYRINNVWMFGVNNDNMSPVLEKGDKAIGFEVNRTELTVNTLCALYENDDKYWLGRVTWKDDGFFIVTYDNPEVPPEVVQGNQVKAIHKLIFLFKEP